jgi:hypothetical protein
MCSCGCNTCETKAPLLTEGVLFEQPISENLLYHIKNGKPITENTFRYGSTAFINLWKEVRTLYSRDILNVGEEDEHILLETHLGEYGMFEGDRVPLDLPMLDEELLLEAKYQGKEVALGKPKRGGSKKFYVYVMNPKTKKVKKVSFGGTTGLTAKINDSAARTNFAKRHNCAEKKDKTKPGYWACRLPRYASLLGLKGSYSGFW